MVIPGRKQEPSAPLVRHDKMRQPGQGKKVLREAEEGRLVRNCAAISLRLTSAGTVTGSGNLWRRRVGRGTQAHGAVRPLIDWSAKRHKRSNYVRSRSEAGAARAAFGRKLPSRYIS